MLKTDVAAYLAELGIKHSPETVKTYRCALVCYGKLFNEITIENILAFAGWLANNTKRATLDVYLSGLCQFCKWLNDKESLSDHDLMKITRRLKGLRGGRQPIDLPKVPIEGDVQRLVGAANAAYDSKDTRRQKLMELRNIAIIHTLRSTGCRVSEVTDMRRSDLRPEDQAAIVTGKGRKQRLVYFDDSAWSAVMDYLKARDRTGAGDLGEPVFCRYDRKAKGILPVSTNVVRDVINQLEKAGETIEHLWPHRFRHRFGTEILKRTHDLAVTQDLLGHSDPKTTRKYAQLDNVYRKKAHESCSL